MDAAITTDRTHGFLSRRLLALCLLLPLATVRAQTPTPTPAPAPAPAPAAADESAAQATSGETGELEEIVVTAKIGTYHESTSSMATKIPMDLMDLPSSLSIMNSTAIRDRNAVALTDVFNYVVGATQSQGNINGFSFRGFPNTGSFTQNIQFDGLMGATLKKAATTAADVDSLEFLKGPNGVLYGQMNPGGLLNIVTKSPLEIRRYNARASLGVFAGEFSSGAPTTEDLALDATGPVFDSKHLFYRLVVDGNNSPSSRPGNNGKSLSLYPSLTYKWSRDTALTVKVESAQDRRRQDDGVLPIFNGQPITVLIGGVPTQTAAYGPTATWYTAPLNTVYNDESDWVRDRGSAISNFFHTRLNDWTLRVQTRSVWHVDEINEWTINNANVYSPTAKYATPTSLLRRQFNRVTNSHRYNFADSNIYRIFGPDSFQNTVLFGVGGGGEFFGNERIAFGPNATVAQAITLVNPVLNQYGYPPTGTGASNQVTWQTALGEYVSDQIKIADRLHISIGLRHDLQKTHGLNLLLPATTTFSNQISPYTKQAGVLYDIIPSVALYGSWSQSIKPQTTIAYDVNGNSDFPPESGEQFEGGVKLETPAKNLNFTLAAYQITRNNVLVPSGTNFTVPTGSAVAGQPIYRLDGKQRSKGFEAELQWQPEPNWQLQAGYAYSKAIIAASITNPNTVGLDLVNAPRITGNFWTRYNVPGGALFGLGFGTGVIYVGQAWAGDPTTALYYQLPAWTRVDSSIYYKWRRYDLALNVQNVLDRRYIAYAQSATTLNVGEQRKFTLSLGVNF
jgi:iron complex outermembrane receptor protein